MGRAVRADRTGTDDDGTGDGGGGDGFARIGYGSEGAEVAEDVTRPLEGFLKTCRDLDLLVSYNIKKLGVRPQPAF